MTGVQTCALPIFFASFYLGESFRWNYVGSFACVVGAVLFAFWGRA